MYSGREVYYIDTMSILKSVHIFNALIRHVLKAPIQNILKEILHGQNPKKLVNS